MTKLLSVIAPLLFTFFQASAQSGISINSGTQIYISAQTEFSVDSLGLKPSAPFILTGANMLTRNTAAGFALSKPYIKRVFKLANKVTAFSGTISFYYRDAELNSIAETDLALHVYNGTAWTPYTSNVTRDAAKNFVTVANLSNVSLSEITLAKGTALKAATASFTEFASPKALPSTTGFSVFPNPARDHIIIKSAAAIKAISLYNASGTLISARALGGTLQHILSLQNLVAGMYTVQVLLEDGKSINSTIIKL